MFQGFKNATHGKTVADWMVKKLNIDTINFDGEGIPDNNTIALMQITIPYAPRELQLEIHEQLAKNRWAVLSLHRRVQASP